VISRCRAALAVLVLAGLTHAQESAQPTPIGLPSGNKNDYIELPPDMEVSGKTRFVPVPAKVAKGKKVQWVVVGSRPDEPVQALDFFGLLMVFPGDQDDLILVLAYTGVDANTPSPPVRTIITVKGAKVDPVKPPVKPPVDPPVKPVDPPAPPVAFKKPAHVTLIVTPASSTPEIAAVETDKDLRDWVVGKGAKWHKVGPGSASVQTGGLGQVLVDLKTPHAVVIQDADGNILDKAVLGTSQGVRDLVNKVLGK
jgi:hypothetical protein